MFKCLVGTGSPSPSSTCLTPFTPIPSCSLGSEVSSNVRLEHPSWTCVLLEAGDVAIDVTELKVMVLPGVEERGFGFGLFCRRSRFTSCVLAVAGEANRI